MVKLSEDKVRKKLESRNCNVSLNMFNDAVRKGESGIVDEFKYMLGKYDPRVHRITPFGASIDLALLVLRVFQNNTETWYEKAFVNNYDYTEETGITKPSPLCEVLSGFQLRPKGTYAMEIMENTQMLKRQITSALDILKLKKSFTWGGAREYKVRARGGIKLPKKEMITSEKLKKHILNKYSSFKQMSVYCSGRPIETISVKNYFPVHWMSRNSINQEYFLAARVAEFCVKEFAKISRALNKETKEYSVYVYPANDDFAMHEYDLRTAVDLKTGELRDESFDIKNITHKKELYYRIDDSENFYKVTEHGEESITPIELLEELHDYRVAYINSLYRLVNARVYKEKLWIRENDLFEAKYYERELARYEKEECEVLEEILD